jgi:hypothetical protein
MLEETDFFAVHWRDCRNHDDLTTSLLKIKVETENGIERPEEVEAKNRFSWKEGEKTSCDWMFPPRTS